MGVPPVEFQRLVDAVAPPQLHDPIELTSRTKELGEGRPDLLARQEVVGMLNTVFREAVHHAWL